jgi:hypothetical protein
MNDSTKNYFRLSDVLFFKRIQIKRLPHFGSHPDTLRDFNLTRREPLVGNRTSRDFA